MTEIKAGAPVPVGYTALPPAGAGPGVLLLHAWWGLNDFFKQTCDRLAAAGYVVIAPDLWGGAVATTQEQAQALIDHADNEAIYHATVAGLTALREHPAVGGRPVAMIGFSMGAAWALYVSTTRPDWVGAVAVFYGTYGGLDFGAAQAAYQGHFAESDPWEPEEAVQELEGALSAAGRPVTFHRYPSTGHWFVESDRPDAYSAEAAELAWGRTLEFLKRTLA